MKVLLDLLRLLADASASGNKTPKRDSNRLQFVLTVLAISFMVGATVFIAIGSFFVLASALGVHGAAFVIGTAMLVLGLIALVIAISMNKE
jgi:amino acid transporter